MAPGIPFQLIKLDLRKYMLEPAKHVREVKLSDMKEFFSDIEAAEKNALSRKESNNLPVLRV